MAVAYMPLGTADELRTQIVDVALDRAFLQEPLPTDASRLQEAHRRRPRAPDADRQRGGAAGRRDPRGVRRRGAQDQGHEDPARRHGRRSAATAAARAQALLADTPWNAAAAPAALPEGDRAAPGQAARGPGARCRQAGRTASRRSSATGGWWPSARAWSTSAWLDFRWLLEELRVSFFAQELRTPQPVSVKRLDKAWAQLEGGRRWC
jgi:ATP-dependent helicase HrpA